MMVVWNYVLWSGNLIIGILTLCLFNETCSLAGNRNRKSAFVLPFVSHLYSSILLNQVTTHKALKSINFSVFLTINYALLNDEGKIKLISLNLLGHPELQYCVVPFIFPSCLVELRWPQGSFGKAGWNHWSAKCRVLNSKMEQNHL